MQDLPQRRHFGVEITYYPRVTHFRIWTGVFAQPCTACNLEVDSLFRPWGQIERVCRQCVGSRVSSQRPRSTTQPCGQLTVEARLRGLGSTWTVTRSLRIELPGVGWPGQYCTYQLQRADGYQRELRAGELADLDFHLILDDEQQRLESA
jgi:hypothetical protein